MPTFRCRAGNPVVLALALVLGVAVLLGAGVTLGPHGPATPSPSAIAGALQASPELAGSSVSPSATGSGGSGSSATPAPSAPSVGDFNAHSFPFAEIPLADRYAPSSIRPPGALLDKLGRTVTPSKANSPSAYAWNGVGYLAQYEQTGDRQALSIARRCMASLVKLMVNRGGALWLPWRIRNLPNHMLPPWYNALSQGMALALFSRFYELDQDPAELATADGLFNAYLETGPGKVPWFAQIDNQGYLWFEHFAGGVHEHVLNAHLWAVFGLYDYWMVKRSPASLQVLDGGVTTMADKAAKYRRPGTFSWYCLINKVAHKSYHDYHIAELRALAQESGDSAFTQLADLFATDYP